MLAHKDLKQADIGIFPPEFVFDRVIEQLNQFIDYQHDEHPLYTIYEKN